MVHFPKNRRIFILFIVLAIVLIFGLFKLKNSKTRQMILAPSKIITLNDNGLIFSVLTSARTVSELLEEKKIKLNSNDLVTPDKDTPLAPGYMVEIKRSVKVKIKVDGKTVENFTLQKNISGVITENSLELGRLDKISPDLHIVPQNNMVITITRINIEEKIIPEKIDFKIQTKNDNKLSWRTEKIEQKGETGIKEVKYKITYKDGKEISRVILEKKITKEPVTQIMTQGTYMELGKANKGQGTWYAWKGGLFAASTTLPRGAYAKVTNTANGKSVVVQINDYGPQGKGRIIDLDKVAFAKIASLGAGVINVKVEEILN